MTAQSLRYTNLIRVIDVNEKAKGVSRFLAKIRPKFMNLKLIVTVDTEEEGLWRSQFDLAGNTVRNVRGIPRFQSLCDDFSIRPTYLVDTPVAESDEAVGVLCPIHDSSRCEIGTHLHPWCAPPFGESTSCHNSYMCNLPESLQREKLARLTSRIAERFGRRPTSFRAGRYGLDITGARILEELGYTVDSSVINYTDFTYQSGPDFRKTPTAPYWVGGDDLRVPCERGRLLEVPVTVGFNRVNFDRADRIQTLLKSRPLRRLRLVGIADRTGLLRRIKFSPEQADAARMNRLADMVVARGAPCVVLMLHSSSLEAGHSPYVPDAGRLEQFYADLEATFEYCLSRLSMISMTLTQFADCYRGTDS